MLMWNHLSLGQDTQNFLGTKDSSNPKSLSAPCLTQQDDFSRRAAIAARANKENAGQGQGGGQGGSTDGKQGSGGSSKK